MSTSAAATVRGHIAVTRVAIVPGCPTEADGTLSTCLWRRAIWAADLYAQGRVDVFVTSGAAVANPFVEADALAAAMIAFGVPDARIQRERNALHTDQNVAWSLDIADGYSPSEIIVASDRGHAEQGCFFVSAWTGGECTALAINYQPVYARIRAGLPALSVTAIEDWEPLDQREQRLARASGDPPRPPSWRVYLQTFLAPQKAAVRRPPLPVGGTSLISAR